MRDVMAAAGGLLIDDAARVFPLAHTSVTGPVTVTSTM